MKSSQNNWRTIDLLYELGVWIYSHDLFGIDSTNSGKVHKCTSLNPNFKGSILFNIEIKWFLAPPDLALAAFIPYFIKLMSIEFI